MDPAPRRSEPSEPPRLETVDLIRGFAVCGILIMNIVSFGMPSAAYLNPTAYLPHLSSSHWVFGISHILADQKFMGLFSLLFGCSAMLFIRKLQSSGRNSLVFYYSRIFWLMIFGMLHSLLLWEGDILFYYGLCGIILYPLWRLPASLQFGLGTLVFGSALLFDLLGQRAMDSWSQFDVDALIPMWSPEGNDIAFEVFVRQSRFLDHMAFRSALPSFSGNHPIDVVSRFYSLQGLARALGFMLIGMAFYSWGIVTGQRSTAFYRRWALAGLMVGVPLAGFGLWQNYNHDWHPGYGLFTGMAYNHVATPLLVFAYLALIALLQLKACLPYLRQGVMAIGRMAFSNYIGQSLLCTYIFYGQGLGLFGQLNRWQLLSLVLGIWIFQFYFSLVWLRYYRYGPLEWIWRTLTYGKPVALRQRG